MAGKSTLKFPKGALLLRQGEVGGDAFVILAGKVMVFREAAGRRTVLARLGPGQVVGELGLVLERPRSANVEALEDTVVKRFDALTFTRYLSTRPKTILPILKVFFERFRAMDPSSLELAGAMVRDEAARPEKRPRGGARLPVLTGLTPTARAALAPLGDKTIIGNFPFRLGRKSSALFTSLLVSNDLALDDPAPYNVSRNHCSINQRSDAGGFYVQDRGSTLGTLVNDSLLGGSSSMQEVELKPGRNTMTLGTERSPFRFEVVVPVDA